MTPKDKLGQPIEVGSIIAYGHTLGRCAGIRIGIVKAIKEQPDARWTETKWHFRVRGIDGDWMYEKPWNFEPGEKGSRLCEKDGTLQFLTRIVVLNDKQVPEPWVKLLRQHFKMVELS